MRPTILGGVAALAAISAAPAEAKNTTLCYKAHGIRESVVKKHGKQAPGRNICRYGLPNGHKATVNQKAKYVRALKRLNAPAPQYLVKTAGPPTQPPAATMSVHFAPAGGKAACIVTHESGGNPLARNGQYSGIAQWSQEAWQRHGGTKYAATPTGATKQQQLIVLSQGLSRYGCRDWCPFDGC
jgi:hypothetical protein